MATSRVDAPLLCVDAPDDSTRSQRWRDGAPAVARKVQVKGSNEEATVYLHWAVLLIDGRP